MATPIPENRASVTSREAAEATGGSLHLARTSDAPHERGEEAAERTHVGLTTDTRAVHEGSVFVALRGERQDGHAFSKDAIARGATLLVIERGRAAALSDALSHARERGVDVLEVDDTLVAWGDLARRHLDGWRARARGRREKRVVAITGSAGKTTTRVLTAALLGAVARVASTAGNLNNRIGVPATIFTIEDAHDFAVLECGISLPGEMDALARIVRPDVAAITFIGLAHAENMGGTREGVATEKGALYLGASEHATLIVNADDALAAGEARRASTPLRRTVSFGRSNDADVRLAHREGRGFSGSFVALERKSGEPFEGELSLVGEGAALDLACALAAADAALSRPLSAAEIARALATVHPTSGRADIRTRDDGAIVVDDTYNANPESMQNALTSLSEIARTEGRRALCVLGEMKELGASADAAHVALGDAVADAGVAFFVGCGGRVDLALERAASRGVQTMRAASAEEAARLAASIVAAGDVVLVKASRSVGAERVVAALLESGSSPHEARAIGNSKANA